MDKILSICIPTYNRVEYLKESLNVLLPQAEQQCVEVIVSDNASSDGTNEYLKSLSSKYKCLRYMIQTANCGLEKNMIAVMSMANTDYILPIGDDEIIDDGALALIKEKLLSNNPDLLVFDGWHVGSDLKNKFRRHLPLELRGSYFFDPIEAFSALWDKMPLGSFAVKTECLFIADYKKFIGTSHAYTGIVWEYLLKKFKQDGKVHIECFSEPCILYRSVKKSYSSYVAQILLYEIPQWFIRLPSEYHRVSTNILSQYLSKQSKIITLLNYRAIGQLTPEAIENLMIEFSTKQKRTALFVAKIPQNIAKTIMIIKKLLSIIKKWIYK